MENKDPKIVIVGAGAAGLSAAHHLVQNGFRNVVILEATDRIGGRIHTVPFGDGIVELGANWIHGIGEDNSMFTLAESKGLIQKPYVLLDSFYGDWLSENGVSFKEENIQKALNIAEKIQEELEGGCNAGQNTSCQEYFENRVAEEVGNFSDEDKEELRPVFNALLASFGDYMGDDPSLISAKLYDISKIISQDWVAIPNGYCGILEALQAEIPENAIQFGRFVTSVIWDNLSDRKAVKVVCNHGDDLEEYLADHVIITCSLGHLKQYHDSLFQPSLPREKSDAIERMGFGNVAKIFLHYEKPFWSVGNGGLTLALESYDSKDEKLWQKSIYKFSEVLTCPNTLLAWVHGNGVRHMESLKDEEVSRVCTELLKKFLHDDKIPEPTSIRISSWSTDPKFLGAYSYYAINSQPSDVEDIAKPLLRNNVPIVCFAGEATDIKWFSFVHGARSSGIREASRLVRLHLGQC